MNSDKAFKQGFQLDEKTDEIYFQYTKNKRALVNKDDIFNMLFVSGYEKALDALVDIKPVQMFSFNKKMGIKATRDIKTGEDIVITVPLTMTETAVKAFLAAATKDEQGIYAVRDNK